MQLRGGSRESGFKEPYKSINYISIVVYRPLHPIPGGCDLAVDRKCAFGAIIKQSTLRNELRSEGWVSYPEFGAVTRILRAEQETDEEEDFTKIAEMLIKAGKQNRSYLDSFF